MAVKRQVYMINLKPKEFMMDNYRKMILNIILIVFGILITTFCFLFAYKNLYANRVLASYKVEKTALDALKARVSTKTTEEANIKGEISSMNDVANGNTHNANEAIGGLEISTIMYDLASETPIDIVFYHQEATTESVKISGYASKQESIGAYLMALEGKKWVSKVNIGSSQEMVRDNGFVYIAFEVTITIKGGKPALPSPPTPPKPLVNPATSANPNTTATPVNPNTTTNPAITPATTTPVNPSTTATP